MSDINWKERPLGLQERLDRLRLGVFDKICCRSLPLRAQVAALRAAAPDARDRERRFKELSPAYAEASTNLPTFAGNMRQTTIKGRSGPRSSNGEGSRAGIASSRRMPRPEGHDGRAGGVNRRLGRAARRGSQRPMADLADLFARPDPDSESHTDILACNLVPAAES